MFGFKYFKFQPNEYVLRYKKGKIIAEGAGLSFLCFLRNTSVAVLPVGSIDVPFIFEEITADFQNVSVQGQLIYRIAAPKQTAGMLNYVLKNGGTSYVSDDPQKLSQRLINNVKVLAKKQLAHLNLREAMRATEALAQAILNEMQNSKEMQLLGLETLSITLLNALPNKETTRALEAQTREQILKTADDAVYARRNASIEQECKIKENEYNTEISVEQKKRQVQETQLEAKKAVQVMQNQLEEEQLKNNIRLEKQRKDLVELAAANARIEADAKVYEISASMKAFASVDKSVIQALASVGMQPGKLMALAFQGLAENADKIGNLNITPDLLREIMKNDK